MSIHLARDLAMVLLGSICIILMIACSTAGASPEYQDSLVFQDKVRPDIDSGPTILKTAIFVVDLDSINTADQSFDANVYIQYRWNDPSQAHEGPGTITKPLKAIWNPRVQVVNQQRVWPTFPETVSISPNGDILFRQRVWGSFSQPLHLRDFPFDTQQINIQLISVGYRQNEVEFVLDPEGRSGMAEQFSIADFKIKSWTAGPTEYQPIPGERTLPSFIFQFDAVRLVDYFVIKVILPLILIVAMSWVVFWLDPLQVSGNIGISITSMLTLIAYRFAVDSSLPKLPYLTRMDYFILASTILVFMSLIQAMITSAFAKQGHLQIAHRIDWWSRILFPVLFILIMLETLIYRVIF